MSPPLPLPLPGGGILYEAELHRMKGELLLMQSDGNRDAARAEFERAMSTARSQGATSIEERAAASLQKATVAGRFDKQTA